MADSMLKESYYLSETYGSICSLNVDGTISILDEYKIVRLLNELQEKKSNG